MIGESLGPYRIVEQLGAGGMGEVYLAEDTRLGRKVAIKVLPPEFASDPERLARFEQEARAAAALNHPHIAVVHDIGTEGEIHFMVQEFLEGQSLRERLDKGELPLDKALDFSVEVAEALTAAHKAGIVHRDLKPDNIFVTEEGHAKVLDFGLAKLTEPAEPTGGELSNSPTMLGTVVGQVMGTAGYMAPEQVHGEPVDHRADLFAFGAVFYEMITGRRAFAGDNVHETLSRIVSQQPQTVHDIRDDLPLKLGWMIDKALAKDAGRRYQSATGFNADLAQLRDDLASGAIVPASASVPSVVQSTRAAGRISWKIAAPGAVVIAAATLLAAWLVFGVRPVGERHSSRFRVYLPEGQSFPSELGAVAISPDAKNIAYVATEDGEQHLFLRPVNRLEITRLEGTEGASHPVFSPDGQTIGFTDGSSIKTVSVTGGEVFSLCTECSDFSFDGDWPQPGEAIIYDWNSSLWEISTSGGAPVLVKGPDPDRNETDYERPQMLPGGNAIVFELRRQLLPVAVAVLNLTTLDVHIVAEEGRDPWYSETGHIIYSREDALFAVSFDAERLRATGDGVPVFEGMGSGTAAGLFSFSRNGSLAFTPSIATSAPQWNLVWVDRGGNVERLPFPPQAYVGPALSPDGDLIAVHVFDERESRILVLNIENGTSQLLTAEGTNNIYPRWSPDGEWIYFASNRNGDYDIFRKRADLSAGVEIVHVGEGGQRPGGISDDGALLVYDSVSGGNLNIGLLSLVGEPEPIALPETRANEAGGMISPDGRYLLFHSGESGTRQVSAMEISTLGRRSISPSGGVNARWSRDGAEIFYRSAAGEISVVEVTTYPERSYSAATRLFQVEGLGGEFDVAEDGQRFLGLMPAADPETDSEPFRPHFVVMLDWFEELKDRLPSGR